MRGILFVAWLAITSPAMSAPASKLEIQHVTDKVYALVGQRGPMSKWNFGTNATFGVIITDAGVVLIDSGASYRAAQYLHQTIRRITDKPVILVINTGSEDLRWLGNGYFKSLGARIITSRKALEHQQQRAVELLARLDETIFPEFSAGTTDVYADQVFDSEQTLHLGDTTLVLKYHGPAYMPGDFVVWLPKEKVVFSGDIVATERMLAVARISDTRSWIENFRAMAALQPAHVVPGHGHATGLEVATADTLDYLVLLRKAVREFIDNGGEIQDVRSLNEYPLSAYERLIGYDMLMGRNSLHVYMALEWE